MNTAVPGTVTVSAVSMPAMNSRSGRAWVCSCSCSSVKLTASPGWDSVLTRESYRDFRMHVEFNVNQVKDVKDPEADGNSGIYIQKRYEVQILDSFGLSGENNECGGVYTKAVPKVNMCLPPLQWQTYDVDFTNAVAGADGKKTKNAVMTLRHNGVAVHEALEINGVTGGSSSAGTITSASSGRSGSIQLTVGRRLGPRMGRLRRREYGRHAARDRRHRTAS